MGDVKPEKAWRWVVILGYVFLVPAEIAKLDICATSDIVRYSEPGAN